MESVYPRNPPNKKRYSNRRDLPICYQGWYLGFPVLAGRTTALLRCALCGGFWILFGLFFLHDQVPEWVEDLPYAGFTSGVI